MRNPLTDCRLLALACCLCAGCASAPGAKKSSAALADQTAANPNGQANAPPTSAPNAAGGAQSPAPAANGNSAGGQKNSSPSPDPRVLDDVMAQIAELGPIEPEARKRLAEDLRKTDPEYWPMLVKTFRASLEYRRRSAQKAAEEAETAQKPQADAPQPEIVQVAANEPIAGQAAQMPENSLPAAKAAAVPAAGPAPAATTARPTATGSAAAAGNPVVPVSNPPAVDRAGGTPTLQGEKAGGTPTLQGEKAGGTPTLQASAGSDWRRHLDAAIAELERQTREHPGETDAWAKQVYLRLLDLAAGRRDDALKPITGVPPAQQDYWAKQIFALSTYLDQSSPDPNRRAAEASLHLARAMAALGEQAPLVVHNLAFCTDVHSYGVLKRFEPAEFHAGQQVLLYAEIENFKSEETAQGFHTSLEASYQIHDRQGQRVAHDDLSLTEEHCQNRRRDFFVRYFITLPKNIYEGDYTLDLTVEDKLGRKINQGSIDFSVKTK